MSIEAGSLERGQMFRLTTAWEPAPSAAPNGQTLLAVGDVHGCAAELNAMETLLKRVIDAAWQEGRSVSLVMLGDYVDRGPDSLGVLRRLQGLQGRLGGNVDVHLLRGNHDQFLLDHLRITPHPGNFWLWCLNGGRQVLEELDLQEAAMADAEADDLAGVSAKLRARLGPDLPALLKGTAVSRRIGEYLFVHAGLHPDLPLEEQGPDEFLWIREPFLDALNWPHPFTVVHGHTPLGPEVRSHRIGLDSGCFFTGVLTAVEIKDRELRFHAVSSEFEPLEFRHLLAASGQATRFEGTWQRCGG